MQKNIFDYCEIQTRKSIQIWSLNLENTISLGVLWENSEQFFKWWTKNNIRIKESEQSLNNAEQKIILCKMLEIVYAENNEQFLWENSEQFYLMLKLNSYFEIKISIF